MQLQQSGYLEKLLMDFKDTNFVATLISEHNDMEIKCLEKAGNFSIKYWRIIKHN